MASVVVSDDRGSNQQNQNANPTGGGFDNIVNLSDIFQLSHSSSWTGSASEYLQNIRKILEDSASIVRAQMVTLTDTAVAFISGNNAIVLVRESDIANLQSISNETLLMIASESIKTKLVGKNVLNIISVNKTMFNRPEQMASHLMQIFAGQSESVNQFNLRSFNANNRWVINIDDNMTNVRQFFDNNSPYPAICGSFGFVASLVDKQSRNFNTVQQPRPMFGITGYNDFIRDNTTGKFVPMVHITDILSVLPASKMLALVLPLVADVVISRGLWSQQFTALGADGINIGNLINDTEKGKPWEVKSDADLRDMFRNFICPPILCIDVKSGGADIPGLYRIVRPTDHRSLIEDIYGFVGETPDFSIPISQNIYKEIVGIFEITKNKFQDVMDIRDMTYLYAISKSKYSPALEYLLTRNDLDPIRRFEHLRNLIGGDVIPTHLSITAILNGRFLNEIAKVVARNISVEFQNAREIPIDINRFMDQAFQPGMSIFGQNNAGSVLGGNWTFH